MPRKYVNGYLCKIETSVRSCSGCFEFNEGYGLRHYKIDKKNNIYLGSGCEECGYTGKRRERDWVPVNKSEWESFFRKIYGD